MAKIKYYLPGFALILSGILIVIFPEILIALLASMVIMAGIGALLIGKRLSDSEQGFINRPREMFHEDFTEDYWTEKKPLFRYYRRWF